MEACTDRQHSGRLTLLVIAAVLLLRLPFLNQAIQGDDNYYIAAAEHAQIDPLHPNHVTYVFEGRDVDFRGYPHPPGNAWFLAFLLAIFHEIYEIPYHVAYIAFSLIAALAMLSLARRFSERPLWATLLFLAVPAFVINGNSFESDIPFLAWWLAGIACFVASRYASAVLFLALAGLTAFQSVLAIPVLAVYLLLNRIKSPRPWIVILTPLIVIAAWQLFEFLTTGTLPLAIATGYQQSYGYQRLPLKLHNALGLAIHFCFIVFPLLLLPTLLLPTLLEPVGQVVNLRRIGNPPLRQTFLLAWIVIVFLGAIAFFYSGAARYLLPLAAPLCILVSQIRPRWLAIGFAIQMTISLLLAIVNYQHWDGYRQFALALKEDIASHRTWIDAEWGLRYYLESAGARAIHKDQYIPTGDIVVTSELAYPVPFGHLRRALVPVLEREIRPAIPLRLIGLDAHSGYDTVDKGYRPFDISTGPIDRVRAEVLQEQQPTREYLRMGDRDLGGQISWGIFEAEDNNQWRWMSRQAAIVLKTPSTPTPFQLSFYIPDKAPARRITVSVNGKEVKSETYPGPGSYVFKTDPISLTQPAAFVVIALDNSFSVPGDNRILGIVLNEAGFRK